MFFGRIPRGPSLVRAWRGLGRVLM